MTHRGVTSRVMQTDARSSATNAVRTFGVTVNGCGHSYALIVVVLFLGLVVAGMDAVWPLLVGEMVNAIAGDERRMPIAADAALAKRSWYSAAARWGSSWCRV